MPIVYLNPVPTPPKKKYSFWNFLFDCFMTTITGGFWLIWVVIREIQR